MGRAARWGGGQTAGEQDETPVLNAAVRPAEIGPGSFRRKRKGALARLYE